MLEDAPMPKHFVCHAELKSEEPDGSERRRIVGYASTKDLDRTADIVEPSAFKETIDTFLKNPILFFNHMWHEPLGTITSLSIDDAGLRVEAEIGKGTELTEKVWTLVKQGLLRAFSFGFRILESKDVSEDKTNPANRVITKLDLLEVSVVTVPANANATFSLAKALQYGTDMFLLPEKSQADLILEAAVTLEKAVKDFRSAVKVEPLEDSELRFTEIEEKAKSKVQSVIFPKAHWDSVEKCKSWLASHDFTSEKVDETETSYRFRQLDPAGFDSFRTICLKPQGEKPGKKCQIEAVLGISKAEVGEGVEEKATPPYKGYELEEEGLPWDRQKATSQIQKWASSDGSGDKAKIDWQKYRLCFFWYDADNMDNFQSYKLPFCYVDGESPKAVPRGIFACAAAVRGARGGVRFPEADVKAVQQHIEKYYKRMNRPSPFTERSFEYDLAEFLPELPEEKRVAAWLELVKAKLNAFKESVDVTEFLKLLEDAPTIEVPDSVSEDTKGIEDESPREEPESAKKEKETKNAETLKKLCAVLADLNKALS
jgi:hypothetical protein